MRIRAAHTALISVPAQLAQCQSPLFKVRGQYRSNLAMTPMWVNTKFPVFRCYFSRRIENIRTNSVVRDDYLRPALHIPVFFLDRGPENGSHATLSSASRSAQLGSPHSNSKMRPFRRISRWTTQ